MKKGIVVTACITVILVIAACICRSSFTHVDSLESFKVGLLSDDMQEVFNQYFERHLEKSKNVVKVRCTSEVSLCEGMAMQNAKALHVFEGNDIREGDEITIAPYSSHIFKDDMSINMGFVNAMVPGDEYLVFLRKPYKVADRELTVYRTAKSFMCTIFAYKDHEDVTPEIEYDEEDMELSVDYSVVKDNEFFVNTKKMDDFMKSLKAEIMQKYQETGT